MKTKPCANKSECICDYMVTYYHWLAAQYETDEDVGMFLWNRPVLSYSLSQNQLAGNSNPNPRHEMVVKAGGQQRYTWQPQVWSNE